MATMKIMTFGADGAPPTISEVEVADAPWRDDAKATSGDIKEQLEYHFRGTLSKDWKRLSKKVHKLGDQSFEVRIFGNAKAGLEAITMAEDDAVLIIDGGPMLYYAAEDPEEDDLVRIMFCPEAKWVRDHCIPDQHLSTLLELHFGMDVEIYEDSENQFSTDEMTVAEVRAALDAAGFIYRDMSTAGQRP